MIYIKLYFVYELNGIYYILFIFQVLIIRVCILNFVIKYIYKQESQQTIEEIMKKNIEYMVDQQEQEDQNNQNANNQQQQEPQYGQIQGQVIKLSGLDYSLLQQQKKKQQLSKRNILDSLKNKINIISGNVLDRAIKNQGQQTTNQKHKINDNYIVKLTKVFTENQQYSHFSNENKKSQKYLQFDLDQFGRTKPIIIEKRIGKISNQSRFVHFNQAFIKQFGKLVKIKQKAFVDARNIIENENLINVKNDQDDDDIFGNDSDDDKQINEEPNKNSQMKVKPKINIQIGKKLNFGIQDDILASQKRLKPIGSQIQQQIQENDKYSFMRKKVKRNAEDVQGYDQCYYQSGPSLKELVDMKKQGIQFFGDLKQFKPKQKKGPNIHKQYQMVQKIIDKKNKQ